MLGGKNRWSKFRLSWSALLIATPLLADAMAAERSNPKLAEMIQKATKEGDVIYQGSYPSTGLPAKDMLNDMTALVKKHFGVEIRIKIDNSLSFPASVSKVLTEMQAGAPPSFDLMLQTPVSGSPLLTQKAIEPVPWRELFPFIQAIDLDLNNTAVIHYTNFLMPEYNSRLVKPKDVPKTWDDLLDPKWKGKLGALIYPDPWIFLAQPNAWGPEKTFDYLKKLMQLKPKLGRTPEAHQWVVSGETPITWGGTRERAMSAKKKGAPVQAAESVDPSLLWIYAVLVPKGARNPNAATLLGAAMLTKEGQGLLLKYMESTSVFRANTPAAEFGSKHRFLRPDVDFQIKESGKLTKEIREILITK